MGLTDEQVLKMAQLYFLEIDGGAAGEWDKLSSDRQEEYIHKIEAIESNFSKIGLGIMPLNFTAPDTRKKIDVVQVQYFIRDFIEKNVKKPSGIINIFPWQELGLAISKEYSVG